MMPDFPSGVTGSKFTRLREGLDLAILGAVVALLAGFTEVIVLTGQLAIASALVWTSRDYGWFTPLSWLAYFALPTLAGAVAMAAFPGRRVWSASLAGFVTLATYCLLNLFLEQKLHTWSLWLISAGVGVQAARWLLQRRDVVVRGARWAALGMGLLTGGIAAVSILWPPANERRLLARLAEPAAGRPNVLVIILDTVRAASLSLYGYARPTTPHLEEWAQRGVVFDEAWSTSPWTLPGHGTIFTGRYPFEFRGDWAIPFDSEVHTLAEGFRDEGYRTGGFVANLHYAAWDTGLDRGFLHYEDYLRSREQLLLNSAIGQVFKRWKGHDSRTKPVYQRGRIRARRFGPGVTKAFTRWLDDTGASGRPFFAFLNYWAAHKPYLAPPPFGQMFSGQGDSDRYDGAIAYLDNELGQLFRELQERGLLDNTLIVVTSDHGEFLGEHGLTKHGNALYEPVLHVPLMIIPPLGEQRMVERVSHPVSLRDLAATVQDVAGLPNTLPGVSLRPFWQDGYTDVSPILAQVSKGIRTPPDEPVSLGSMYTLRDGPWHLILNGDCREELYDLRNDPTESHDLRERLSEDSVAALREMLYTAIPVIREGPCGLKSP